MENAARRSHAALDLNSAMTILAKRLKLRGRRQSARNRSPSGNARNALKRPQNRLRHRERENLCAISKDVGRSRKVVDWLRSNNPPASRLRWRFAIEWFACNRRKAFALMGRSVPRQWF